METYHRNIIFRRDAMTGTMRPTVSFPLLTDALEYAVHLEAGASKIYTYEVIDLEHLDMGDMRQRFTVEDGELVEVTA